jgi:hypothetical protein
MMVFGRLFFLAALGGVVWSAGASGEDRVICCGGEEVFVVALAGADQLADADPVWRWTAADSPEIPEDLRSHFRTTDDCKPTAETILITSSSGGVALVTRSDKKSVFYTSVRNAHSACRLPKNRIAVASSYGGDALLIYSLAKSGVDLAPLATLKFEGAHGALWDHERQRIWALGDHELLLVEVQDGAEHVTLQVQERWKLPTAGGHDLMPARDARHLFVTTNEAVYRFDTQNSKFEPFAPLAKAKGIKSIDEHPETGRVVYQQADAAKDVWWSDKIRLLEPERTITVADERLYKVRWDVDRGAR